MHVDDPRRAGALVQVVDVLRDEGEPAAPLREACFERGEREMGRVRPGGDEVAAARVVEGEHRFGVAGEGLGGRELHGIELRPDPAARFVAESPEPALGRNPGAGEDEDGRHRASQMVAPNKRRSQ